MRYLVTSFFWEMEYQNLKIIVLLERLKTANTANKEVDHRNNPKETTVNYF